MKSIPKIILMGALLISVCQASESEDPFFTMNFDSPNIIGLSGSSSLMLPEDSSASITLTCSPGTAKTFYGIAFKNNPSSDCTGTGPYAFTSGIYTNIDLTTTAMTVGANLLYQDFANVGGANQCTNSRGIKLAMITSPTVELFNLNYSSCIAVTCTQPATVTATGTIVANSTTAINIDCS